MRWNWTRASQELTNKAYEKWRGAIRERATFSAEMGAGQVLTEAGKLAAKKLNDAIASAEKDFRAAEDIELISRQEFFKAEIASQSWVNGERLRRQEESQLAEEAKRKPVPAPLGERLSALKAKITG